MPFVQSSSTLVHDFTSRTEQWLHGSGNEPVMTRHVTSHDFRHLVTSCCSGPITKSYYSLHVSFPSKRLQGQNVCTKRCRILSRHLEAFTESVLSAGTRFLCTNRGTIFSPGNRCKFQHSPSFFTLSVKSLFHTSEQQWNNSFENGNNLLGNNKCQKHNNLTNKRTKLKFHTQIRMHKTLCKNRKI